ncbi:MAG: NifU family protein [Candidatus Komeilibacteria bacterium]
MKNILKKIEKELDVIRPFLEGHGGGVEIDHLDDQGVLYVKFKGACVACPLSTLTYQNLIADRLSVLPEVKEVKLIA